jgi:NAD(P)-dependent dehydrogenase (short-subunit alcohol dehydrogenase family)
MYEGLMATGYTLLTGASRGIGHTTVKLFQEKGWRILTVSRQPFSEECAWPTAKESHIQADLADLSQVGTLVAAVRERLPDGKLHALVNNAGISPKGPGGSRLGVGGTDAETWTKVLNVNLISTALLARALLPELEAAEGLVVNVLDRGLARSSFCGRCVCRIKSRPRLLDPRARP